MKRVTGIRARDMTSLAAAAANRRGGTQDLTLICLARDAMLRPREIPAMSWEDLVVLADGTAEVILTGLDGIAVTRPVSAYTARLLGRLLPDDGDGTPGGQLFPLTGSQINRRVAALCEAAGMPGEYAASSPRIGKAMDLADGGMTVEDLRAYGRWRSLDSAWTYIQRSPSYGGLQRLRIDAKALTHHRENSIIGG